MKKMMVQRQTKKSGPQLWRKFSDETAASSPIRRANDSEHDHSCFLDELFVNGVSVSNYCGIGKAKFVRCALATYFASCMPVAQEISFVALLLSLHHHLKSFSHDGERKLQIARSAHLLWVRMWKTIFPNSNNTDHLPMLGGVIGIGAAVVICSRKRVACDLVILSLILRLLSAVLRTLTESYSGDTIYEVSVFGLVVHLLCVDYDYANGWDSSQSNQIEVNYSIWHKKPEKFSQPIPFRGGILALNASLLSTTLLASRLSSDFSAFVLLFFSVLLFGLYPAARHVISKYSLIQRNKRKNSIIGNRSLLIILQCFIMPYIDIIVTACIILTTSWVLCKGGDWRRGINNDFGLQAYFGLLSVFCVISPTLTWYLSQFKKNVAGPWDIAKINLDDNCMPVLKLK